VNVFLDTNILLDVLGRREPFFADSAQVWTLAETGQLTAFVSALSLPNLFYVMRRTTGQTAARKAVRTLEHIFSLVPLDVQIIRYAIDTDGADFEDAIQFFSAIAAGATALITRNLKHFPQGDMTIQSPAAFLAAQFPG
jgi:predicted nucleic acid-binding protein